MDIRIKRIGIPEVNGDPGASDTTSTYRVIDNGQEFWVTFRSHLYGSSLGISGQPGVLYTDKEDGTVHRHVLAVGRGCGIGIESDEVVEGLSPWSVRGVILAHRSGETEEITVTAGAVPDRMIVCVGGRITDLDRHL